MVDKSGLPDITRLFELQNFLHKFHFIERVVYIPEMLDRNETDTEHSFTLAMTSWYLAQFFPELDINKCIRYSLVHDLVEIYAGDTFAFAEQKRLDSKASREKRALEKIAQEWKDFPEMINAIRAYESLDDAESKFVYALDKVMPPLIIFMGEGLTWRKNKITFELHHKKKLTQVPKSPEIYHYYKQLVELMKKNLEYFHQEEI